MNYDKILDKIFFNGNKYNISKIISYNRLKLKKYINIQNYIINRFDDSLSERETLYRIHYKIYKVPTCPVCGKKLKFYGRKNIIFLSHCSNKCKRKDNNVIKKWKSSCGELGTNREKSKKTMVERYGVENPYQIPEIINKIKEINKNKKDQIIINMKHTCNLKYNVDYYLQTKEFKEKSNKTSLKKYGTQYPIQSNIVKDKYDWKNITKKISNTKRQNNSFNKSKPEDESYILLKEKFEDVKRQYRSDLYPFNCDFYIPNLDIYIECQYGQFHHRRPYLGTEEDLKDIEILKENANRIHKEKNVSVSMYDNELETWTIRDVNKRNIAKQNNLNYLEFWNIEELKEWLKIKESQ